MNGETVCSSHPVTVLSCAKSLSLVHDDKTISLMQEGRHSPINSQENDAQRLEAGRRPKAISMTTKDSKADFSETESTFSQCSPGWSDEQPSAQQHRCPQSSLLSTPVTPLLFSNSLSHSLLHNNNNNNSTSHHGRQRRGVHHREKRQTLKSTTKKNLQNRKVTDYYPIRRSSRKSKTELKFEQKKLLDDLITNGIEEGMEVQQIEGKGRAVFATRHFQKGEYVVEYHGDLLQITDAKKREAEYAQNPATGCYMYYFQYLCKTYCVDATKETGRMGRLINHSKNGNCQTKLHDINGIPHLILVASRNIDQGEELLYDYGDRSKASIAAHPWLKD